MFPKVIRKMNVFGLLIVLFIELSNSAPVLQKGYVLVPVRDAAGISRQSRQGGIIAGWIQNSQFFPIAVNVPNLISNATSGIQQFGQSIGQGIQNIGQNWGQGIFQGIGQGIVQNQYQTFISNLGQRFPLINRLPLPGLNQNQKPQKYFILLPTDQDNQNSIGAGLNSNQKPELENLANSAELFTYP